MAEMGFGTNANTKIPTRSRRSVSSVIEAVCLQLDNTLNQTNERNEDGKSRYRQRFREIFESTLQQNILVNGQTWESASENDTSEFEPVDRGKEKQINDELLPHLDDCIVSVAGKRKQYPWSCRNALTDFYNQQAAYMVRVKPQVTADPADSALANAKQLNDFIKCDSLQAPSAALAALTKTTSEDFEKAVHLSKAVGMQQADKDSKTAAVVFSGSPGFCELEQPSSSAKRRLAMSPNFTAVQPRTARTDASVFGSDFVVKPYALTS